MESECDGVKKVWLVVIIALFSLAVIGGYAVLDSFFPKADPINCPNEESITAISLTQNNSTSVVVDAPIFAEVLENIRNAQPTRQWSVNDYPTANTYYTIEIDTPAREYRYFVYVENSQVYIEDPYDGVYKANQQLLDFVAEYFKE